MIKLAFNIFERNFKNEIYGLYQNSIRHFGTVLLARLGTEHELSEETLSQVEKYVIHLYSSNDNVRSINSLRGILAASIPINKLPPHVR